MIITMKGLKNSSDGIDLMSGVAKKLQLYFQCIIHSLVFYITLICV